MTNKHIIPNVGYGRLEVHELLLRDEIRVCAYREAINSIVKPGDNVLDFGTGSGILAFFAQQAGANHVFALEREQIIAVAQLLADANDLQKGITFVHGDVDDLVLAHKVDVLMSECIGSFGINTFMINDFFILRDKFLSENGRVIPLRMRLLVAPFTSVRLINDLDFWQNKHYGIDFSSIAENFASEQMYLISVDDLCVVAPPIVIGNIDFTLDASVNCNSQVTFQADKDAKILGFCGWFELDLTSEIVINTAPDQPATSWYQVMFPMERSIQVSEEDQIFFEVKNNYNHPSIEWEWTIIIYHGQECLYSKKHCTVYGFPKSSKNPQATGYPSF